MRFCLQMHNRRKIRAAGSYHGEILDSIITQLILRAAVQGKMGPYPVILEDCDNLGVVQHGNTPHCLFSTTQTHADLLRVLKRYIVKQPFLLKFLHVASHADDTKTWESCSLKEKINIKVEHLAKTALICAHATNQYFDGNFPFEEFQISLNGFKVTGNVRPALDDHWGRATAKYFFNCKGIVSTLDFDTIWWPGVKAVMSTYPKMFRIFVPKQVSGWCGSNSKRSLWDTSFNNICPNCGMQNESSKHMTRCKHDGWVTLFCESTCKVVACLEMANTDPTLIEIIESYLHGQGTITMESCVPPNSRYLHLSQTQDRLGWDCFIEARIPTLLLKTIQPFLHQWSPWKLLIKWGISFLKTLLNLTHKQWIFCNADVHHKIDGLISAQHDALSEKIRTLMKTSLANLLPCHYHLLDRNFHNLGKGETIHRQLLITSMESVISAAYNISTGHFTQGSLQIFNKHTSTTCTHCSAHHSQHCSA